MLSIILNIVIILSTGSDCLYSVCPGGELYYTGCHYDKCHFAECWGAR
jgi:hypothetical protein